MINLQEVFCYHDHYIKGRLLIKSFIVFCITILRLSVLSLSLSIFKQNVLMQKCMIGMSHVTYTMNPNFMYDINHRWNSDIKSVWYDTNTSTNSIANNNIIHKYIYTIFLLYSHLIFSSSVIFRFVVLYIADQIRKIIPSNLTFIKISAR